MATQMSPEDSTHSSCGGRFSSPRSTGPVLEPPCDHPGELDIREVQAGKRATVTRWSKKHGSRRIKRGQPDAEDFNLNAADAHSSFWDISEAVSDFSKRLGDYVCHLLLKLVDESKHVYFIRM